MAPKLLKVDKNGTKYWTDSTCPKCGGKGTIDAYYYNAQGVCFQCGGSGYYETNWKEYTPEYAKKLEERRLARLRKKAPEENAKWLKSNGFSEDGTTWIVIGNTWPIKEELKAAGAKFNGLLGWHFDHDPETWPCFTVTTDDVCYTSLYCTYFWAAYSDIADLIKELRAKYTRKQDSKSEYIGTLGEKLETTAKFIRAFTFTTHYTYTGETNFIYKFVDANDNILTWKTTRGLALEEGEIYTVKGTIKEHAEYKGEKQTQLTRCSVRKEEN